jgi:putative endonuclease
MMLRRGILNRLLGDRGERAAAKYLKQQGYRILARQSRSRIGEIDLIAVDGQTIVFVEVKTRTSLSAGHPAEAITIAKRRQLTRTALAWLKRRNMLNRSSRFDVIAITWQEGEPPIIEHYKSAFEPTGDGQFYA